MIHHLLPVEPGEALRALQLGDAPSDFARARHEPGKVRVGQRDPPFAQLDPRHREVLLGDLVADTTAHRVQESPPGIRLTGAHLDGVVAAAESAKRQAPGADMRAGVESGCLGRSALGVSRMGK